MPVSAPGHLADDSLSEVSAPDPKCDGGGDGYRPNRGSEGDGDDLLPDIELLKGHGGSQHENGNPCYQSQGSGHRRSPGTDRLFSQTGKTEPEAKDQNGENRLSAEMGHVLEQEGDASEPEDRRSPHPSRRLR